MVVRTIEEVVRASVMYQRAELVPGSWSEEDRSVEAVLSTGARGRRRSWGGDEWDEELEVSPSAIRMGRLNAGCSVLDSHNGWSLSSVIGRVVPQSARIEGGKLLARLQLSVAEEHKGLVANVRAGIVSSISIGYRTHKKTIDETATPPVHRAVDWEVFEVSFVPIGFDAGAATRSAADREQPNECTVIRRHIRSEGTMEPDEVEQTTGGTPANGGQGGQRGTQPAAGGSTPVETRGGAPAATASTSTPAATDTRGSTAVLDADALRREGAAAEMRRQTEIRSLATRLRIEEAVVTPMLADSARTVDQARAAFVEHIAVRSDASSQRLLGSPIQVVGEERDKVRAAAMLALCHRGNPGRYGLSPVSGDAQEQRDAKLGAREFAGMSLLRMGEELARRQDPGYRWENRDGLMRRMFHSTSDFPYIAQQAVRRTLRDQYEEAEASWKPWVRQATMQDFRTTSRVQLSAAAALKEVPENGEIEGSELGESVEGYKLSTFARRININRQTIINDDMDAFSRIPMLLGAAARRLESDKVYAILTANAAMSDAVQLFHATHANLITPVLALGALNTMRISMRQQRGQANEILNLMPKFLIVPAALETTGWQLLNGEIVATAVGSTNPFKGSMTLIVEPRLDATSAVIWFAACSPNQCDTVEIAFLDGSTGPIVEQHEHFDALGMSLRVYHDVGTKAIDWRGMIKSSGTT